MVMRRDVAGERGEGGAATMILPSASSSPLCTGIGEMEICLKDSLYLSHGSGDLLG